ncbi:MAG: hypothetical protein HY909_12205 [Deltaproteobacteria bacterium]|nr:hypothetical protein [Deltaproteobacteria bacterium]
MTFDVTLHPFDERDYTRLLVPTILGQRPEEELQQVFGIDAEARRLLRAWLPKMRAALGALRAGDGLPCTAVVHVAFAAMSAHRHPAYHLGDLGLSYWSNHREPPFRAYTRSMAVLAARIPDLGVAVGALREGFSGPYTAGSFVPSGDIAHMLREVERSAPEYLDQLQAAGYQGREELLALLEALHYARERHLALLEVTHSVAPDRLQALFPINHLRAPWRETLPPAMASRFQRLLDRARD